MQWINCKEVDVGEVGVVVELYGLIDHGEAQHSVLLLCLRQLHPIGHGPEPVVVEEVAVVAPQRPLCPPPGRAPRELPPLVLPEAVTEVTRVLGGVILLAWKIKKHLKLGIYIKLLKLYVLFDLLLNCQESNASSTFS